MNLKTRQRGPCLTSRELASRAYCVTNISKDARGELRLRDADRRTCPTTGDCPTLLTRHELEVEVRRHDCDGEVETDGRLRGRVTTVFDTDGTQRGVHAGELEWDTGRFLIQGTLRGMTNVGLHRERPFEPIEKCHQPGVLRGVLCGEIVKARDRRLVGARVTASYRFEFEPDEKGGSGRLIGTIEGMLLRACPPKDRECVDFAKDLAPGTFPNPVSIGGHSVSVEDYNGSPLGNLTVTPEGLNAGWLTTISLGTPADEVTLTVITYTSSPITVTAYDASGAVVDTAVITGPQGVALGAAVRGSGIVKVTVEPPQNETFLVGFCA